MPNVDSPFSTEYLDNAVESLRKCLRDLKRINDRPTALASRERCKNWMDQAVKVFKELREEYDEALGEIFDLKATVSGLEVRGERFEYLVERIADVQRGILTVDELAVLASDINYGEVVNVK